MKPQIAARKLTLWPLVAATFFMVSGGTFGTEDIVHGAGYKLAVLILLITPVIWSVPTALMLGELSAAIPAEGGYYVWVRRALGNFWGFQEAWLSLVASIFDMAVYPGLFILYLARLFPSLTHGHNGVMLGIAMVLVCVVLNLAGVQVVAGASLWLFFLLSSPFALIAILGPIRHGALAHAHTMTAGHEIGLLTGILIAMWNYMGWDNASTIAGEVDNAQRTYPRAMLITVAIVAASYALPVIGMWATGAPSSQWETGSWADWGGALMGAWMRPAIVIGAALSAFAMFNSLVMSYSRLPLVMAQERMLPSAFARVHPKTGAPWVAVIVCAAFWACTLGLGFERTVTIDIMLYGLALTLEFVALVVLRLREPQLARPFRVPGGMAGAIAVGIFPTALLGFSLVRASNERILGMSSLAFGAILVIAGFLAYIPIALRRRRAAEVAIAEEA